MRSKLGFHPFLCENSISMRPYLLPKASMSHCDKCEMQANISKFQASVFGHKSMNSYMKQTNALNVPTAKIRRIKIIFQWKLLLTRSFSLNS